MCLRLCGGYSDKSHHARCSGNVSPKIKTTTLTVMLMWGGILTERWPDIWVFLYFFIFWTQASEGKWMYMPLIASRELEFVSSLGEMSSPPVFIPQGPSCQCQHIFMIIVFDRNNPWQFQHCVIFGCTSLGLSQQRGMGFRFICLTWLLSSCVRNFQKSMS